jgi:hypothetical protein
MYRQPDSLSSGLVTQPMLDVDPPSARVQSIRWDSGFRGTVLEVGDRIVAINGQRIVAPSDTRELQVMSQRLVGQVGETQVWKERGLPEAAPLTLRVRRRAPGQGWVELDVTGPLRSAFTYQNSAGRQTLGPGGPDTMASDGMGQSWSYWLEKWERWVESILDDDWSRPAFATDSARSDLDQEEARLTLLAQKYGGPCATAIAEDAARVRKKLEGTGYELAADALAFRTLDDERAARVAAAATAARAAFVQQLGDEPIRELPLSASLLDGELAKVAGRVIELPPIRPRDWLTEATHNWFAARIGDTWCLADTQDAAAQRMQLATRRYLQRVHQSLREDYAIIGRIKPAPRLIIVEGRAVIGVEIEPLAAMVGDRMFVDLTVERDGQSMFAGEADASRSSVTPPSVDASPEAVLDAFFAALKAGDLDLWSSLFASWRALASAKPIFYSYRPRLSGSTWEDARRRIEQTVCDIRAVWSDDPAVVIRGDEYPGLPRVEEVAVEVDHIRQVGEAAVREFRSVRARGLTRVWRLQRLIADDRPGPWRIVTESGI